MLLILGIDPGAGGALALYDPSGQIQPALYDMPSDPLVLARLITAIAAHDELEVVIEQVHSLPRQQGAFRFGFTTGIIHGVLAAHDLVPALAPPSQWKPAMGLRRMPDESETQNKARARALATQLFPQIATQFKRVRDDGRAEALLLAVYYHNKKAQ